MKIIRVCENSRTAHSAVNFSRSNATSISLARRGGSWSAFTARRTNRSISLNGRKKADDRYSRRRAKIAETSVATAAYSPLQSDRNFDQDPNSQRLKRRVSHMAQTIGTIILVILALVAVSAVLNFIL